MDQKIDKKFYVDLGKKLRIARESKGYSLEYVAKKVGLTKKTIQRYETAESRISRSNLVNISTLLEIEYPIHSSEFKNEEVVNNLGCRIKDRREKLNLTQQELADKLGYDSRSSINKIEIGKNDVPFGKVNEIAKEIGRAHV